MPQQRRGSRAQAELACRRALGTAQVALVTGGTSGIGLEIATQLGKAVQAMHRARYSTEHSADSPASEQRSFVVSLQVFTARQ